MLHNKRIGVLILAASLGFAGAVQAASETTGQYIDDATLTTKVKAALVADETLHAGDVTVTTDQGVVKLTGTVDNQQQYAMAGKDANSVSGIKTVSNMLTVRSSAAQ